MDLDPQEYDENAPIPRNDELDELVTEVQDAFFEARYGTAIKLAETLLERFEEEEDTWDMLLASYQALGQYEDVIVSSEEWVGRCGESLRQLVHLVEAAYMLDATAQLEDASFKLCFLYESSEHDPVFAAGAVLGVALALDCGLPFPDCLEPCALLENTQVSREPLVWWVKQKLTNDAIAPKSVWSDDAQTADFEKCLFVLLNNGKDASLLRDCAPVDASGVVARHLWLNRPLIPLPHPSRIHPLFRKRFV